MLIKDIPLNTHFRFVQKETAILQLIHRNHEISRAELAKLTGISPASLTTIVRDLYKKGLVAESRGNSSRPGRKPVAVKVRDSVAYFVGADIGSFYTRALVTDINGNVLCKVTQETKLEESRDRVLQRTFEKIHKLIGDSGVEKSLIKGVGMTHSGVIDADNGLVLSFPRPGQMTEWRKVPLRDMVESEFGARALVEDSVRMAALAEKNFGAARKKNDFIFVTVSMGIGAAILIDGQIYRGPGGNAGEFGHITVDENGPLCSCGNKGCLEALASCAAIIRTARNALEKGVSSKLTDLTRGELDRLSIELIARAACDNDALSFRIMNQAAEHIGIALADLVNILNPKSVILGGPLFQATGDLLLEPVERVIRQHALEKAANDAQLMISAMGPYAASLGAARLIAERMVPQMVQLQEAHNPNQYEPKSVRLPL